MQKKTMLAGAALLWSVSTLALAHAHLASSEPADKAVAVAPQALTLTFTEDIEPAFSGVTLLDGQQKAVASGKAQRDAGQPNRLTVPLQAPLRPGDYQVRWHVLSVDGHKTQGSYRFSVK